MKIHSFSARFLFLKKPRAALGTALQPFRRKAWSILTRRRTIPAGRALGVIRSACSAAAGFFCTLHPVAYARSLRDGTVRAMISAGRCAALGFRLLREEGPGGALRVLTGWGISSFAHGRHKIRFATPVACLFAVVLTSVFWTSYGLALDASPVASGASLPVKTPDFALLSSSASSASSVLPYDDEFSSDSSPDSIAASSASSAVSSSSAASSRTVSSTAAASSASHVIVNPTVGNYRGDPFSRPECVWYAWGRAKEVTGVSLDFNSSSGRSARYWLSQIVQGDGVKVVYDKNAVRAHSIAVFRRGGEGNGHVLFVEDVRYTSSGKPRSVVISESNWDTRSPNQKVLSWDDFLNRSHGSLQGYIYLP